MYGNSKEITIGLLIGGSCSECKYCTPDIDIKTDWYFAVCDLDETQTHFPEMKNGLPDIFHRSCRKFQKWEYVYENR